LAQPYWTVGRFAEAIKLLAFDGTNFLLAYTDARAQGAGGLNYAVISASRISSGGVLLDSSAGIRE
jgi:hypothetical protein